uniref:Cerebellin 20 n=1 Tax=Dicentrarchus labrax TaxID=13489 RepID=A0A8C4DDR2_DICLA
MVYAFALLLPAIVLLCLFGAVFVHANDYSWNGPGTNKDNRGVDINEENEKVLQKPEGEGKTPVIRSAFSVALTSESNLKCFGPFRDDNLIVYKHVFINLGDGYSAETGIFTVPRSGVYSFALTVYSDAGAPGNSLAACATLQVNGNVVAGPREKNMQDQEDSATIVVALHLTAEDKVAVNLPIGCFLCDDKSHYNTFTGFLLYATD